MRNNKCCNDMYIERTPYAYFDRDEIERVGISSKCLSCGYVPQDKDQKYFCSKI